MGSKPQTPSKLDVPAVTDAQRAQNNDNRDAQKEDNRINQYSDLGSVTYDAAGNQTTKLAPDQLALLRNMQGTAMDAYKGGIAGLGNLAQSAQGGPQLDPWGVGQTGVNRLTGEFSNPYQNTSSDAFDKSYEFATARMNRDLGEQEGAIRNRLANQGLAPGSEAYEREIRNLRETGEGMRNEAAVGMQDLLFRQGMAERGQNYNEAAGLYNMGQQAGAQQFSQQMAPYQMLASQGGLINPVLNPGVSSYNQISVPNIDVAGLYQASKGNEYQNYNAQMQQYNAMLGGMGGLVAQGLMGPIGGAIGSKLMGGLGSSMLKPQFLPGTTSYSDFDIGGF